MVKYTSTDMLLVYSYSEDRGRGAGAINFFKKEKAHSRLNSHIDKVGQDGPPLPPVRVLGAVLKPILNLIQRILIKQANYIKIYFQNFTSKCDLSV